MGFSIEPRTTVAQAVQAVRAVLQAAGDLNPPVSAKWLVCHALGIDATALAVHADDAIPDDDLPLLELFVQRRLAGEPLQYIAGVAPFRYLELDARPGVFIPRPETEVLVSEALRLARGMQAGAIPRPVAAEGAAGSGSAPAAPQLRILDLCCGSGTIGVSVAYELGECRVVACDISDKAVSLARANAHLAGVDDRTMVLQGDLFDAIKGIGGGPWFDLVLSNPPYVPSAKMALLAREIVEHEPREAFEGGADGLDVFRRILLGIAGHLRPGGYLLCELDEDALEQALLLCTTRLDVHFDDVRVIDDLTGRPRVIVARRALA